MIKGSVIKILGYDVFQVSRASSGDWTTGVYQPGIPTTVTIRGRCQPLTGAQLVHLEEGDRTRERRKLYSLDQLFTGDERTQRQADVVTIDDRDWEVESCARWTDHWKAIIAEKAVVQS